MVSKIVSIGVVGLALATAACGDTRGERVGSGALIGAGSGALIGGAATGTGGGALAGGAIGAVGGALIGDLTTPRHRHY